MEHLPQQYRHLFPILQTHTMLASCSQSALAEPVSRAIQDYHDSLLYKGTNWKEAIEKTEFARNEFAKLIGAEPDEVAIVPSVSDALVSVASSLTAFGSTLYIQIWIFRRCLMFGRHTPIIPYPSFHQ